MPSLRVGSLIGESLGRTGRALFTPVLPSRWLRWILIAFLAGSLGTGGCGLQTLNRTTQSAAKTQERAAEPAASEKAKDQAVPAGEESDLSRAAEETSQSRYRFVDGIFRPDPSSYPQISKAWIAAVLIPLALFLLALFVAWWILSIWISVRFKFAWLYAVREGQSGIRALFHRCRREADELFDFWLGLSALEGLSYLAVIAWLVGAVFALGSGWSNRVEWTPELSFQVAGPPLGALALVWFVFTVLRTIGNDFVVPLAVRYPGRSRAVWERWIELYRRERGRIWLYLFWRLLLSVFWMAVQIVAIVLWVLCWTALFLLLLGGYNLSIGLWDGFRTLYPLYLLLIGVPSGAILLLGIGAALLPSSFFFRDFSLQALDRLDPPAPA